MENAHSFKGFDTVKGLTAN